MEKRQRAINKKDRVPLGGLRKKLELSKEDMDNLKGWHLHWFNDKDGRIEQAENAGYTFVSPEEAKSLGVVGLHEENTDLNSRVSKVASKSGESFRTVLMKINQDWHNEDVEAKIDRTRDVERKLRPVKEGGQTIEGGYTPS